jgi:hypothetical protein
VVRAGYLRGVLMRRLPILFVFTVLLAVGGCSQAIGDPDSGEVTVHNYDSASVQDPWIGMIIEYGQSSDHEFVFLAEGTAPSDLNSGDGLGMYSKAAVVVFEQWGTPDTPVSRPELISAIDSRSSGEATTEIVWLAWSGGQKEGTPTQYEIQAALEHEVTEGFRLHPECYVVDTRDYAVAVTDKDLTPAAAWKVGDGYATFESVDPSQVECEVSITEWRYEDEF